MTVLARALKDAIGDQHGPALPDDDDLDGWLAILSEEPAGSGWNGATGFVTEAIGRLPESVVKGSDAYVCGPPPMVDAVEAQLLSIGVDAGSFHADRFLDTSGKSQQQKAPV